MANLKRLQKWVMAGCLGLASCAGYQRTDLYFGRDIPGGGPPGGGPPGGAPPGGAPSGGGGTVSEQQWKNFSDSVISNYFPEGYTEWDANGRWKDTDTKQTITEPTKVVTFFGKKTRERSAALDSIAQRYLRRFRQQSVLRTDMKSKVKFINKAP